VENTTSSTWLRGIGTTVLSLAILSFFIAWLLFRAEGWPFAILLAPPTLFAVAGALLFRARQHAARMVSATTFQSGVPNVLYLRPFEADVPPANYVLEFAFQGLYLPRLAAGILEGWATEEEQLSDALKQVGPLVAIGRPGERLPIPGAARKYAGEEWSWHVLDMMRRATLVVIRAGISPGVLWELEQARKTIPPQRLVLLIGPETNRKKAYRRFQAKAERLLHTPLPAWPLPRPPKGQRPSALVNERRGYIRFTRAGVAHYVPIHAPHRFQLGLKPVRRMYAYSFKPVLKELNLAWSPPARVSALKFGIALASSWLALLVLLVTMYALLN
jgi:hypothetical protein